MLSQKIDKYQIIGEEIEISLFNIEECDNNENTFVNSISSSIIVINHHLNDEIIEDQLETMEFEVENSVIDNMEFDKEFDQINSETSDLNFDNPPTQSLIQESKLLHHHEEDFSKER